MPSLLRFFATMLVVLIPPYVYLGYSLAGSVAWRWTLLAAPFLSIASLPALIFLIDRSKEIWWRDLLLHSAHVSMGVVTFLATGAIVRDLARITGFFEAPRWSVLAFTLAALIVGAVTALTGPKIKRVSVPVDGLPEALRGLKVVQISDLHAGPSIGAAYVARVVRMTNALEPDLVLLTGDIADGDLVRTRDAVASLAELKPRGRVFYVTGNHEYYWNADAWVGEFEKLHAKALLNEGVRVPRPGGDVWIGGIIDPQAEAFGGLKPDVAKAFGAGAADCGLKILLSHRPGFAHEAAQAGFDLQLSGHTHGGQFFPWTLVVAFVHEFHLGLRRAGRAWVYVSPGTGTWGPLLRLGTTPELTLLTMERATPPAS